MSQIIEHPAYCPECGGRACIETGPLAVHCGAEHDGGDPCDWRIPLGVEPGVGVVLVATSPAPTGPIRQTLQTVKIPHHLFGDESDVSECCGRTRLKMPNGDRITSNPDMATCRVQATGSKDVCDGCGHLAGAHGQDGCGDLLEMSHSSRPCPCRRPSTDFAPDASEVPGA